MKEGRFLLRGACENLPLCFCLRATKFADLFDPLDVMKSSQAILFTNFHRE